jgi:hypothetical protein
MSTFLSFHIKTKAERENLTQLLKELSGIKGRTEGVYPEYMYENISLDENADPGMLAIAESKNGWINIYHNSFQKLHQWGAFISKILNTSFIQIAGQTSSEAYYFLLYEKGALRREIEIMSMDAEVINDKGEKFPFEKEVFFADDSEDFFDMSSLEEYCTLFGLDINSEPAGHYIILSKTIPETVKEVKDKPSDDKPVVGQTSIKKPWWKPW